MADTNKTPLEEYAASVTDGQLAESQAQAEAGGSTWKDLAGKAWDTMVFLGGKVKEAATWAWEKGKELVNKWLGKDVAEPGPDDPQEGQPAEPEDEPQDGEEPEEQGGEDKPQGEYPWSDPNYPRPREGAPEPAIKAWEKKQQELREAWEAEHGPYEPEASGKDEANMSVEELSKLTDAERRNRAARLQSKGRGAEAEAALGSFGGSGETEAQYGE